MCSHDLDFVSNEEGAKGEHTQTPLTLRVGVQANGTITQGRGEETVRGLEIKIDGLVV